MLLLEYDQKCVQMDFKMVVLYKGQIILFLKALIVLVEFFVLMLHAAR